ncbi:MAG TPA: CRISPR-associated protein Cas5, partial [Haliangium sp.]|nr:CRISPR-associated protein Cas5 [Haliangium sp.]
MNTLWLRLRAPFAAYRWLQAGVYRATSPIIPPSAAWGLLLNLAHIETRDLALTARRASPVTLTR